MSFKKDGHKTKAEIEQEKKDQQLKDKEFQSTLDPDDIV